MQEIKPNGHNRSESFTGSASKAFVRWLHDHMPTSSHCQQGGSAYHFTARYLVSFRYYLLQCVLLSCLVFEYWEGEQAMLNTFQGSEMWNSKSSNMLQVLISIQGQFARCFVQLLAYIHLFASWIVVVAEYRWLRNVIQCSVRLHEVLHHMVLHYVTNYL